MIQKACQTPVGPMRPHSCLLYTSQISRDYEGRNLVLVSILKGSVVFMADLMRAVTIPCSIDFMVVSSYGGSNTTTSGLVKIIKDCLLYTSRCV